MTLTTEMTKRRVLSRGAQLLAAGGTLPALFAAGCGQQTNAPATMSKDTKASLVWYIWSSNTNVRGEAYNAIVGAYQQEYPNVAVEQISGGGNLRLIMEKLITMLASDHPIDIVGVRHDVLGFYVNTGVLKDLTAFSKRESSFKFSDHLPSAVEMLAFKGKSYALPIGMSTSAIAYNADLFRRAGVRLPDGSWDWKQFLETAQRLTNNQGENPIWGTHILPTSSEIFNWIWMNGGEPFSPKEEPAKSSFVQPESLEAVQWFTDLNRRYGVKAPSDQPDGRGSNGRFGDGRVAFFPIQSNNTRELQDRSFEWDVAPFPKGKKGTVYPLSSFSYGIYNKTKNEELAWKLWTTIVGPTGQREWMIKTGEFIPSLKSLQAEYERVPLSPKSRKVFSQAAANGRPTPKATKYGELSPIIDEHLQAADTGKMGVRAALESLDRQLAPILSG
jgi:multiple sugar transport system substrate-binding protein